MPYWIKLTYAGKTLSLETAHHGNFYEKCFDKENVELPTGYYFGVSAATASESPDQQEVMMLETYQINPPMVQRVNAV